MNLSIKSTFATLVNNLIYASAPVVLDANIILPEYQIMSEKIENITKDVVVWIITDELGVNYINTSNLIDIVGDIVSINVAARSQAENNSTCTTIKYTRLPRESLENVRIFTDAFVNAVKSKIDSTTQSAEDDIVGNDLMVTFINIGEFTMYANWLPTLKLLRNFNDKGLFTQTEIYKVLDPEANFVPFPDCMQGLALILQPWIIQYITNLLTSLMVVTKPNIDTTTLNNGGGVDEDVREIFKMIYELLCHFNSSNQRNDEKNFRLTMRHLIYPFLRIKNIRLKWLVDFFETIFTKDLSQVTAEFSKYMPKFYEIDIDPTFVSDMIVFLFGQTHNSTNEQTLTNVCEGGRRKRILKFNTIDNQLINNKMPMFNITKIRTTAIDPIFLIAHKLLTRSCQSNSKLLTQSERNRQSNLLYTPEEKNYISGLVMARYNASMKDNNRSFVDPFSDNDTSFRHKSCSPTIARIGNKQYEYIRKMKFNKLIKYPSDLTFSDDNYAETSLKFMRNLDAYSALFTELVNREVYDFNNIVCNIRPIFQ